MRETFSTDVECPDLQQRPEWRDGQYSNGYLQYWWSTLWVSGRGHKEQVARSDSSLHSIQTWFLLWSSISIKIKTDIYWRLKITFVESIKKSHAIRSGWCNMVSKPQCFSEWGFNLLEEDGVKEEVRYKVVFFFFER